MNLLTSTWMVAMAALGIGAPSTMPNIPAGPQIDTPTGYFHTKQVGGRWWIVDPTGKAFYWIGTDHISYGGHWCETLGYAPYGRNAAAKYGSEEKWAATQEQRLKDWGFNTLPYASDTLKHRQFAHVETLSLGTMFSDKESLSPKTTWTGFPNVFSPEWPKFCDQVARERCARVKDDPWVMGYFLDNELEWYGTAPPVGLFGEAWRRPAGHSAKVAWLAFLQRKLRDPAEFEQHWGIHIARFAELAEHTHPVAPRTARGQAIVLEFLREIAERYFRTCSEAIRRHDPNHMILGCRYASRAPAIWDITGRYCDIVTFNYYKWIDVKRGVPEDLVREMTAWHRQCKRPMVCTEWSFPALDAGLPSIWGGGMRVDTQAQRAQCFRHFQTVLFALPFMVGSSYFMYIDEPAQGISRTFPEDCNYGLIDVNDNPYPEMTQTVARVNRDVYAVHGGGTMPPLARKGRVAPWVLNPRGKAAPAPPDRLALTTGSLRVEGPVEGHAWRMWRGGVLLGDMLAYVEQDSTNWLWVPTDRARIVAVREDRRCTVVDMEMSSEGKGPLITRLTVDYTRSASDKVRPCAYRGLWRFVIPRGDGGWISMQCVSIQNTDPSPWTARTCYMFVAPSIGGSPAHDEPLYAPDLHSYYVPGAAWVDRTAGAGVGCWFLQQQDVECTYWIDRLGRYRSDMRYPISALLQPGQSTVQSGPPAFFFALDGVTREDYERAEERLRAEVIVGAGKAPTAP